MAQDSISTSRIAGAKSWLFLYRISGRRREMGLGPLRDVPLARARELAAEARKQLIAGADPLTVRKTPDKTTFGEAAGALIERMSPSWRNDKHRAQWFMTLRVYCASLTRRPVDEIRTEDVLSVLQPLWQAKSETASRIRGKIERVLDFAKARGMREGENPARWRGHLDAILPKRQHLTRGHHKALPFKAIPDFMRSLESEHGVGPKALLFTILTAARSGEVLGSSWGEIDLEARIWTVPAKRMKAGREHRVPLLEPACRILRDLLTTSTSQFVFPGCCHRTAAS